MLLTFFVFMIFIIGIPLALLFTVIDYALEELTDGRLKIYNIFVVKEPVYNPRRTKH